MNRKKRILFVGHCYYNHWYLTREMQKLGWRADVLNIEADSPNQSFYHGEDFRFASKFSILAFIKQSIFFVKATFRYEIFVFSGIQHLSFGHLLKKILWPLFGKGAEIRLLKLLSKKIVYSNNGCRDGVLQSSFSRWKPYDICSTCAERLKPDICSDHINDVWGQYRNKMADYQLLLGGNRADYNIGSNIIEAPWIYSLSKDFWSPTLLIPSNYLLNYPKNTVKLYHSVGNFDNRRSDQSSSVTIKSTHIYLNVVNQLQREGFDVELIFFHNVPNKQIVYYMAQADIVVDMLTFGFFGGNVREGLMMGKPVICYLRPEWMEMTAREIPLFVSELPIISATPDNVKDILIELIQNKEKREAIGKKSREFAVKWFSSENAAREADIFFSRIIEQAPA